ncbi:hypothetical protein EMPS_05692 [Entomortierella parvispora]|uniref:Uncharacterized protein n=1 Tax=Entomortierella parvispora TaxID=205924 RepID=A0A9P3HAT0_9FUNG|nr:hypothetical protein EMPS_05692 [Entomortierella parvispora]
MRRYKYRPPAHFVIFSTSQQTASQSAALSYLTSSLHFHQIKLTKSLTMVKLGFPLALALSLVMGASAQMKTITLTTSLTSAGSIMDVWRCWAIVEGCNGKKVSVGCSNTGSQIVGGVKESCSSQTAHHSDGFDFKIEECNSRKGVRLSINGYPLGDKYLDFGGMECTNPTLNTFRMECTSRNDYHLTTTCF